MGLQQEQGTGIEQEPKPKVLVTFYGHTHETWNLQGIEDISKSLAVNLESSRGKNIVFFEFSGVNPVSADLIKKGVKQRGFLKFESHVHLKRKLGRDPTEAEIQRRIDQVSSADPQIIVEKDLIMQDDIRQYFLFQKLDELKKQWNFEFEVEFHPKSTTRKIIQLMEKHDHHANLAIKHWDEGKFAEALESYVRTSKVSLQMSEIREKEIVDYLKGQIRTLLKEQNGGSLFILFGAIHSSIIGALQKKLGPKVPVKFNTLSVLPEDSTIHIIYKNLREGKTASELVYAQELLSATIVGDLVKHAKDNKSFSAYANNSETADKTIRKIMTSLSLEEIRRICEEKQDVLEFLRKHPQAESIKFYIS